MNLRHAIATYRGHTVPRFRLIERRNRWFALSGIVIGLGLVGLIFQHLNFSIDFEGGTQIQYPLNASVSVADIQQVMAQNGHPDAEIQIVNGTNVSIRTDTLSTQERDTVLAALAKQAGITRPDVSDEVIGPTWGGEISRKALTGLVVVLAAITLYITIRFEWKMAIGGMIALVHDLLITVGIYALVGREVTPETVIAVLTILGFSLYDTVVIYDKVKENTESPALLAKHGYAGVVNISLNQVLMRSVNTSLVVLLPILSLLLFGGDTLKDFAFAMFVGVTTGAYSSIFIAAPILTILKGREQRFRQMDARRLAREGTGTGLDRRPVPASGAPEAAAVAATSDAAAVRATARSGGGSRPRPKGRKPPAKRKRR